MKRLSSHNAFTLVEVLVGVIIVGLISITGWISVSVLMRSSLAAENRSIAVNLLQKSQEELRRTAQTFFDQLENCQFPQAGNPGQDNSCGLADTSRTFPGFARTVIVTPQEGSAELKRALVTVSWKEMGVQQQLQSLLFISRPPTPLPGNIIGRITSQDQPERLIGDASVNVIYLGSTLSRSSVSRAVADGAEMNFTFAELATGRFLLPAGSWRLTATRSGFYPYTHPETIIVNSNEEVAVDVALAPLPQTAYINVRLRDTTSQQWISSFARGIIDLYKDGVKFAEVTDRAANRFAVPFSDASPQCFTVNTYRAYRAGYAGAPPSCQASIPYSADGWSSARNGAGGALLCQYPWNGSVGMPGADPDRICVDPGDDITVEVPLVPIPRSTITGRVVDNGSGQGIAGATVYVNWPAVAGSLRWGTTTSVQGGYFSYSVPAAQEMFANGTPAQSYLQVWAQWTGPLLDCCGMTSQETRRSSTVYIGPLRLGETQDTGNLVVPIEQRERACGNAQGNIKDDLNQLPISAATVNLSAATQTDAGGNYSLVCPSSPTQFYRLPRGNYEFTAQRPGYYDYRSRGNRWYARVNDAAILANQMITYDARLWPKGYGRITGTVRDHGTGRPLPGAAVRVVLYDSTVANAVTDQNGQYMFNQLAETWPPAAMPATDPYYQHAVAGHTLSVTHPSGIYLPFNRAVDSLNNGQTLVIDVDLTVQGNM